MVSSISLSRVVSASAAEAFAAWTDKSVFRRWWWPQLPDTTYSLDVRAGGSYIIQSVEAAIGVCGDYHRVEPAALLDFSWLWAGESEPDRVVVLFTPLRNGETDVTVVHISADDLEGSGYQQGWADCLARLPDIFD